MKTRLAREYMGRVIFPAEANNSGIRWTCRTSAGNARADTLAGIKLMIRGAETAQRKTTKAKQ